MKTKKLIRTVIVLILLGGVGRMQAQYSGAPNLSTTGSSSYTTIATAINGWASTYVPPVNASSTNSAFTNRSAIIDQVEATILAAGKATITDGEYDILADALAWWCDKVAGEGANTYHTANAGYVINAIGITNNFFVNSTNCVWKMVSANIPIQSHTGSASLGYGPMLGANTRLVLFTDLATARIYRNHENCDVMFSTNGVNSKLLFLGRKNNKIVVDGGQGWSDPSSYEEVLNRTPVNPRGPEVVVRHGAILSAYTTFENNATDRTTYTDYSTSSTGTVYYCDNGSGVSIGGVKYLKPDGTTRVNEYANLSACALYHTDIKNNHLGISDFPQGGGICVYTINSMPEGVWFNHCNVIGNNNQFGHGGGLSTYFDGGDGSENDKVVMRDVTVKYNCQASNAEKHGGGMFHRDTHRKVQMYNCNFTENYAHGLTCGGGGISTQGHLELNNCEFHRNVADNSFGGAIYAGPFAPDESYNRAVDLTTKGCIFDGNQCTWVEDLDTDNFDLNRGSGGGIFVAVVVYAGQLPLPDGASYSIKLKVDEDCVFTNNHADRNGGAIAIAASKLMEEYLDEGNTIESELEIKSAIIHDNTAGNSSLSWMPDGSNHDDGGAIYLTTTDLKVTGTNDGIQIYDNSALRNGGSTAIYKGNIIINGGTFGLANHPNTAINGGGFYVNEGTVTMNSGVISYNNATVDGGGFYNIGDNAVVNINNSTSQILYNIAENDGGGFYLSGGVCSIDGGVINENIANKDGGGFFVNAASNTSLTTIEGGATVSNNSAINGAGAYVNQGHLIIQDAATNISNNTASTSGGGIYMANGTVNFTNAKMRSNTATNNDGGGLYLGNGTMTVNGTDATFSGNKAKSHGGGVYVGAGSFTMTGGTIGGTTAQGNYTTGNTSYGGGLYMGGGTATVSGGAISGNHTDSQGQGGGIYMNGGTCTLSNGAVIGGVPSGTQSYANSAKFGGGIYSAGGTITVKGGKLQYNTATTAGGGIYTNGASGVVNMEKQTSKADMLSYIEHNTAQEGGGIYANRGVVNFSDGFIQYNYASEAGGGIYVNDNGDDDYGTLYLKGSANLRRNHVPTGHNGGGVYLKGMIVVGEQTANLGVIKAQENFAGDEYIYTWNDTGHPETDSIDQVTANNRNNIYLPNPGDTLVLTNHRDVITVIENGISLQSNVGFSVPHNYVPVIYCAPSSTSQAYLDQFSTGHPYQYMVFDDTRHYVAVHYPDRPEIFDPDHVYLYGFWANVVTGNEFDLECPITAADFEGQNPIEISTACELAFFISWVNGLNGLDRHSDANAILLADIDMSKYGWVPIGDIEGGYSGTFDGNGHTVTGISSLLYREYLDYGFFGRLNGGTVKDLFVKDAVYALDDMPNLVIGGLVGYINTASTVSNCEASSKITASNTGTIVGGLVGRMNAGTVHSTIGISDMSGYLMGGLVGELLGGNLYNSFSNCRFTKADPTHDKFMGGLVAVNRGTVENCYARRRGSVPKGKFGILVGDNTNGLVKCCYAPAGETNYTVTGNSPTGHGNYGDTYLPYLYGHRDTQISLANNQNNYVPSFDGLDKQMLLALNSWVDANSTSSVTYTKWGRPWHENDNVKPLNDDYPILRMPMAEAVGAKVGDPYLYYNPVDSLLVRYTAADEAIWLYNNPADVVRGDNSGSDAKLYIAEDVALINLNELKAYVGITLDNSAGGNGAGPTYGEVLGIQGDGTDWHLFSTSLSNAPTGINYSDGRPYEFSYGHPTGMPYYLFYEKGDARNGYFPSHRFGKSYPSSDLTIEEGNYYQEWDFYCYSEPCYHWINFKRNSNSHRRYDTEQHEPIAYDNEPTLGLGKGYFFATREETFLQCQGNLNTDEVIIGLTYTPNVPRHGYNLIGNPYQAYLDFNAFAEANQGDVDGIWDAFETPSYTILDEDCGGYVTFAYDESNNPDAAGRFIHPHQGFFVRTLSGYSNAYFEPEMRNASDTVTSVFRNDNHIDYPLVNLFVSEANGVRDMVTVELGRPEQGGAAMLAGLRAGKGRIWCHYNDKDYTVAYTEPGITEAAIRFETFEDTEYTMRWNTYNGDFSYLHLIDNLTGADVDCLSESEYRFSASTSDYKSRFRLVFGYTGIEEDIEAEANTNFAFMMGDELVVTGEGVLQVFDVNGRMLVNQELHGVQTMVSLPNVANGVYVLRLTEGKQSRIQKMVISK